MNKLFCDFCKAEILFEKDKNEIIKSNIVPVGYAFVTQYNPPNIPVPIKLDNKIIICNSCIQLLTDTLNKKLKRVVR